MATTKKTKKPKKDILRKGANCSAAGSLLRTEALPNAGRILAEECGGLKAANKKKAEMLDKKKKTKKRK